MRERSTLVVRHARLQHGFATVLTCRHVLGDAVGELSVREVAIVVESRRFRFIIVASVRGRFARPKVGCSWCERDQYGACATRRGDPTRERSRDETDAS